MINKPNAPEVTSLTISKLSGNQGQFKWDNVGSNFYYIIDIIQLKDADGKATNGSWTNYGYVTTNKFYIDTLENNCTYKIRVTTTAEGFKQATPVETEEFTTFDSNVYTFQVMNELNLVTKFIRDKFTDNNNDAINFKDAVVNASLMNENFVFSPYYENISSIKNFIVVDDEYHEVQGDVTKVCVNVDRTYLMEDDGILYLFERYQNLVKVSNDRGQTWKAVKLLNDRVGYPLSRTIFYQNVSTSYVLGYTKLFYGRRSTDTRWSADDVRFSSQDVTFAKVGDQLDLGYDVDIFGVYASLPGEIATIAEAITASDDFVYVVARDVVRKIKVKSAPIDTNVASPTFGERIFEDKISNVTGNPKSVVWKMDCVKGRVYALVIGEVSAVGKNPRVTTNVIDSKDKGIYLLDPTTDTWTRVYGNTEKERRLIEHGYTNMSCSLDEIYFSSSNFMIEEFNIDDKLPLENELVSSAVTARYDSQFFHDKKYMMQTYRTGEANLWGDFKVGRMKYYAEPFFSRGNKSNTMSWIDNNNRVVVVYADTEHTQIIDKVGSSSPSRVVKETWNDGECVINFPNVTFNNFNQYANGIMFYDGSDGDLIGFYEFDYRVKDEVHIVWKPRNVFLTATLQNQEREVIVDPKSKNTGDPNLVPFTKTIMPDSYLLEDTNFEKFCEYYIEYISSGQGTPYNNLVNLIKNKHPREKNSWEYMWSEVYKRNIYLDKEKRDDVSRFFETRKNDFYSTKGTEASYKFLFKLLYNEEVDIEVESTTSNEYYITVDSDNINQDLVGKVLYTNTGRANVSTLERTYRKDGKMLWKVSIHNMIGRFIAGQSIKSETQIYSGMITEGIKTKEFSSSSIDYINRTRSYYTMKIKSVLPTSRYKDDIMRFVHPVGLGFIGITMLTMFINSGLSMRHVETIIEKYKNYRWSDGLPKTYPDRVALIDDNDNIQISSTTGRAEYVDHSMAGQDFPLPSDYDTENGSTKISGQLPSVRRKDYSPTFDQSAVAFSQWRQFIDNRLKDNINNPRDPSDPTQYRIEKGTA